MPSSYSPSLRLELIGNGEQAGSWGTTTNKNLGTMLEQAITGSQTVTLVANTKTLTVSTSTTDESRNAVLNIVGSLTAIGSVIAPLAKKTYIVSNNTTGSPLYSITIGASSGATVTIPNGATSIVYCDGTNFKLGLGSVPIADLPMNGFKHTGAIAATATGEYAEYDQMNTAIATAQASYTPSLQMQTATAYTTGGTSSAYTVSPAAIGGFVGSIAVTTGILTVTTVAYGTVRVGMAITGTGIAAGARITALIGGSGGTGTYQTNQTAVTVSTTITGYAGLILNQRFRLKFNVTGAATPTLSVSGTTATLIKQYNNLGVKTNPVIIANQLADVEYDGTNFVILNPLALPALTSGTVVASTSGTSIDFTSIPSYAKRITVIFDGVSADSGTTDNIVQIGDSGGIEVIDYDGVNVLATSASSAFTTYTSGFLCMAVTGAGQSFTGTLTLHKITGNTWVETHFIERATTSALSTGGGSKTLSGVLDRVRITSTTGTSTFDAGSINIMYE